ncbi:MAG TPA: hypothetical protein VK206_25340 [Anaerolineales bacterium]|nr:hypothetical protein [Anaerolineales bacterium]HLO28418.1 hypothetical protein [Anaerolineales bacterium]
MKKSSLVIELIGPPGAGKTTLSEALSCREAILTGAFPNIRAINNLPFFIGNGFALLPTFYSLYRGKYKRGPTRQELAYMTILTGWPRVLESRSGYDGKTMLLDQGPVYMLTELLRFDRGIITNGLTGAWWRNACKRWAETLDLVIRLDAPDKTLIERIRRREKFHGIKTNSDARAIEYLTSHRSTQEKVLSDLLPSSTDDRVVSFDTTQMSLDETVTHILELLKKIKRKNVNTQ